MVDDQFDVRVDLAGAAQVVRVQGELDLGTADRFSGALRTAVQAGDGPVVVDLCDVPFMDSTGLHLLLNLQRRLARSRRSLAIACAPTGVHHLFELTRMDEMFDLHETCEAAIAAVQGAVPLRRAR